MASLNGQWKLTSVENFEDYMKALGVSDENIQKGLKLLTPENNIIQDISIDGENFNIKTTTPVSTQELKGVMGKEFEEAGWDGRPIKKWDQVPWRSKHPLQTGYTRRDAISISEIVLFAVTELGNGTAVVKVVVTLDGEALVESQSGPYTASNTRYVKGGNLIMEQKCGSVSSTRTYTKI